jgi:hypothetical protein
MGVTASADADRGWPSMAESSPSSEPALSRSRMTCCPEAAVVTSFTTPSNTMKTSRPSSPSENST